MADEDVHLTCIGIPLESGDMIRVFHFKNPPQDLLDV